MNQIFASIPVSAASHWVDAILVCILFFYVLEGFFSGAVYAFFDLLKFVASFVFGLFFYSFAGNLLMHFSHIPKGYANAVGFFLIAFLTEVLLHIALQKPVKMVNAYMLSQGSVWKKMNAILGIFPGILSGAVLVMFMATVLMALPVSPYVRTAVSNSSLGSFFADRSQLLQKDVAAVFGGAAQDTLNFLTVEPQSNESVSLGFRTTAVSIDPSAEQEMLQMVNKERISRGIAPLTMDQNLQTLAQSYAREMLAQGYFSHYTPDGKSPFDRMNKAGIQYTYAGENLAFSANVELAMQGLMNSPGHRANILNVHYKKVGIGVINAGIYGEMFDQEFTD